MSCGCDVSSVGMILVAGDRFLLGIGLEPKVADFWFKVAPGFRSVAFVSLEFYRTAMTGRECVGEATSYLKIA